MKNKIKKFSEKLNLPLFMGMILMAMNPILASAQSTAPSGKTLAGLISTITTLLREYIVGLIFTLGFVYFFWGVVQYVLYPDEENKKDKGRQMMITGIIALTVMFSVYGLISILQNTLGLDNTKLVQPVI